VKTTSEDGLQIAYDVNGAGRSVILLHGFGNDRTMWLQYGWTARLENDFKVIALDFRGCGESDKPEGASGYSIDLHLSDVKAVIAACDANDPIVWGWSLGATVALHFASRGQAQATVAAGTYFGPIFTSACVQARIAEATREVDRARLLGMGTWPEMEPYQIRGRLLVYTGTNDGNVVKQLKLQREAIETAGGELEILGECNHLELISETQKVWPIVEPFLRR